MSTHVAKTKQKKGFVHVRKRRMETSDQSSSGILQTFWGLSSLEEGEQLQSAKQLIVSLNESQEANGDEICADILYTLKRLVRGLASNRKGARQGFFIALTELLSMFPMVPLSQVFELIQSHLEPTGSDKAAEERGAYFGKLFALLAVIKSGRVLNKEDIINISKQLHSCSQRKTYLREFCYVSIAHLVDVCHAQGSDDVIRDNVIPLILDAGWDGCLPEQLFLYLHLRGLFAKEKWFKQYLSRNLGSKHVISGAAINKMSTVLLASTNSHPRLHCVWPLVLEGVRNSGHFDAFWKNVVDESLFSSSHERKFLGFKLLETLLPTLTTTEVTVVFSPSLLSCLLNNSSAEENYLHLAAKHLLSELSTFIKTSTEENTLITLYLHLQRSTANKFDQLSGTKVTEEVLSRLSVDGATQLLDYLTAAICDPSVLITASDNDPDTHGIQLWALDQILLLIRQTRIPRHSSWLLKAAKTLLLFALFKTPTSSQKHSSAELTKHLPKAPLPVSIQQAALQRLISALSDLSSMTVTKPSSESLEGQSSDVTSKVQSSSRRWTGGIPGVMEDGGYFLTTVFKYISEVRSGGGLTLLEELTDEVSEACETVSSHVSSLSAKENLAAEERAFLLLFSATGLQLLCSVEERESTSKTLQEISICFSEMSRALSKKKSTPKKPKAGPGWMSVLTDVLLGFLSNPSQLWRNVVEQVFKQLTHCVTEDSLKLILEVLELKQSKSDLMAAEDEEGSESDEASEENGVSEVGGTGDSCGDGGASESGEGSDDSGDDASVAGEGVDPMFRAEVRRALGAAAMDSDAESEVCLDDEAMEAVDDALAEVFRTRFALKHQKKAQKDEEKSVVHFKLRVLGLVDAFVRKETSNTLIMDVVVPLYEMIQGSQSRKDHTPLMDKAKGIFKNRLCHMKEYPKANIDVERLHGYLQRFVDHLGKANTLTAPLLTQGFLLLIRVLRGNNSSPPPPITRSGRKRKHTGSREHGDLNVSQLTKWLADSLREFFTKKNSNINPVFFSSYFERYPSLGAQLVPTIIESLPSSANHFRKTQVYEMLAMLRVHAEGDSFNQLTDEDLAAIDTLTTKSKRRKHRK